jgi:multidrug efflux pump subunit AcrA (membrane-fusion protein)
MKTVWLLTAVAGMAAALLSTRVNWGRSLDGVPPGIPPSSSIATPVQQDGKRSGLDSDEVEERDPADRAKAKQPGHALTGLVTACRAAIRAPVAGRVTKVAVREEQVVRAGEQLVQIDDTEMRLELLRQKARAESLQEDIREARSHLEVAKNDLERTERLFRTRAVAEQSVIASRHLVDARNARLSSVEGQARAEECNLKLIDYRLRNYQVLAPFSGLVTEVVRQPDTYAQQGEILLHIESLRKEVKIQLPMMAAVELDQLKFSLFHDSQWIRLPVTRVRASSNADGSRTIILALAPDMGLISGQMVQVQAVRKEAQP